MANPNAVQPVIGNQHGIRGQTELKNITLPMFSGDEWYLYALRVQGEFRAAGLWSVVGGAEARPAVAGDPQTEWDRKSDICRAALLRSLSNAQLVMVAAHEHAPAMWNALKNRYAVNTSTRRTQLFEQILNFARMQSGSLADHIAKYDVLNQEYQAAVTAENIRLGQNTNVVGISEEQKRSILTRSLPTDFVPFVQSL